MKNPKDRWLENFEESIENLNEALFAGKGEELLDGLDEIDILLKRIKQFEKEKLDKKTIDFEKKTLRTQINLVQKLSDKFEGFIKDVKKKIKEAKKVL